MAAALDIQPGSRIRIQVKKDPTNEAAAKTLSRLFAKDPANRKARRHRKKLLAGALDVRRRGGRPWEVRPKAPRLFQPTAGESCSLLATCDVINDLGSVARFIDIQPAR
jgi:hypothetical protein